MFKSYSEIVCATFTDYWQGYNQGSPNGNEWKIGAVYSIVTGTGVMHIAEGHDFSVCIPNPEKYVALNLGLFDDPEKATDAVELNARKAQDPTYGVEES